MRPAAPCTIPSCTESAERSSAISPMRPTFHSPPWAHLLGGRRAVVVVALRSLRGMCALAGCGGMGRKEGGSGASSGERHRAECAEGAGEAFGAGDSARAAAFGSGGDGRDRRGAARTSRSNRRRSGRRWATFSFATIPSGPRNPGAPNTRRFHYELEPAHAGKHLIRSVSIEFIDKRANSEAKAEPVLIETEPLEVNVTSELGE